MIFCSLAYLGFEAPWIKSLIIHHEIDVIASKFQRFNSNVINRHRLSVNPKRPSHLMQSQIDPCPVFASACPYLPFCKGLFGKGLQTLVTKRPLLNSNRQNQIGPYHVNEGLSMFVRVYLDSLIFQGSIWHKDLFGFHSLTVQKFYLICYVMVQFYTANVQS